MNLITIVRCWVIDNCFRVFVDNWFDEPPPWDSRGVKPVGFRLTCSGCHKFISVIKASDAADPGFFEMLEKCIDDHFKYEHVDHDDQT